MFKVEFNGFKRLEATQCNLEGKVIAFIGPNESGKSTVLTALEWLTADPSRPLQLKEQTRRNRPAEDAMVVRAFYKLDKDDIQALQALKLDVDSMVNAKTVTEFRYSRRTNGQAAIGVETTIARNKTPWRNAATRVEHVEDLLRDDDIQHLLEEAGVEPPIDIFEQAREHFDVEASAWRAEAFRERQDLVEAFRSFKEDVVQIDMRASKLTGLKKALERATDSIEAVASAATLEDPIVAFRRELSKRLPKFVLFDDTDRSLAESYNLADESVRNAPPSPLVNMLLVAGVSVDEVWSAVAGGDGAELRTLEKRMNQALLERLQPMWTQSKLTLELTINQGGLMEVNIDEIDDPASSITPLSERSEGLRAFIALVCFLIATNASTPPVLMIDEAERNLHYDAQADLVRVLTRELNVHKVIYTTHSPGCLPLDLGTGIRVVARDPANFGASQLLNTFWTNEEPGFSHLLFAMGAQAAAFSAFRRAVLTEGVSEMMLLPTLLRNATGGSELDFQVAFGLSNMSVPRALSTVALITVFLVDGDASGDEKKKQLLEVGVPESHVHQLPAGYAVEDLVERAQYLSVVNEFLAESERHVPAAALDSTKTVARAVDDYARAHLGLPDGISHKIIAFRLAEKGENLKLSPLGRKVLPALRRGIESALTSPYALRAASEQHG
ncbi:MAG: AAA family ATPase [Leifsonia sp.]